MNTVHSVTFSGEGEVNSGRSRHSTSEMEAPSFSPEINRMLSAAVVSAAFRRLLLTDPAAALSRGYNGESFEIQPEELAQIVLIRATSLAEFADQLIDRLWFGRGDVEHDPGRREFSGSGSVPVTIEESFVVYAGPAPGDQRPRVGNRGPSANSAPGPRWM